MDNEVREPEIAYGKYELTIAEYLGWESGNSEKHEYFQGEVFSMAGAKLTHNIITGNIFGHLKQKLKGKHCQPYSSDQRIHIPSNTLFTYPDISVICGAPVTLNNDELNVLNPSVIVEVLSASTKNYDRGEKFKLYREITTLQEYILVDSATVHIELHRINSNGFWELQDYKDLNDIMLLPAIQISFPLTEIYEGVHL